MSSPTDNLRSLIAERAIVRGPVRLSSGSVSAYYFDCKRLTLSSDGAVAVGDAVVRAIESLPEVPTAIGGLTHGADPIIGAAMLRAFQCGKRLEGFYVRKEPKKHGTQRWVENAPKAGTNVVIVDDVVTTGKSVIDAIDHIEKEGCVVAAVIVLVDRLEGGGDHIRTRVRSAPYMPLYTLDDFPEIERIKQECASNSAQPSHAGSV